MYDNDMYRTFSKSKIRYNSIFTFEKQNKDYLVPFNKSNFTWCYSDSLPLKFTILDPDEQLKDIPEYAVTQIIFYDFRFEKIYEVEQSWANPLTVDIDKDTSLLFKKGIHYCSVTVSYDDTVLTVIPSESCIIEVI